jgi:tetratricopeptide (TPR) repeat protein
MRTYCLSLAVLAVFAVSLAATLEPWFQDWAGSRTQSQNVMQIALGDSRRLFAQHFFTKADVYFHSGYYPSVFDERAAFDESHATDGLVGATGDEDEEDRHDFLGKPRDWIDRFSRNFFPARHTHLGDSGCGHSCCHRAKQDKGHDENCAHKDHGEGHDHAHDEEATPPAGLERELLPWLRLSAEMDPQRVETYVVASFWLRSRLGKVEEAEQFLREGLRANPGDGEILFELGRIYHENRKDATRARHVLELALKKWREREGGKPPPDRFLYAQILNQLALLEREQDNYPRAIDHYTALKDVSPHKEAVQAWIDYLKTNGPPIAAPSALPR